MLFIDLLLLLLFFRWRRFCLYSKRNPTKCKFSFSFSHFSTKDLRMLQNRFWSYSLSNKRAPPPHYNVRGAARHLPLCQNPVTNAKRLFTDAAADTHWVLPIRRRHRHRHRRRCRHRYSHITAVAAVDWWRCWRCKLSLFTALRVHYRNNFTFMNTSGQRPN